MRRAASFLIAVSLATGACAERPDRVRPREVVTEPAEEKPADELPGATCDNVNAGNPANLPDFVDVELESVQGVDRITFTFEPERDAPEEPPWHFVSFVDELITEGEGRPVQVAGEAFVLVSFQAIGVDLSGEEPVEVYTGPKRFNPGFGTLKEAVHLGDFEAQVSWGLGLGRRACYVVEAEPDRLTLEFASA